MHSEMSSILITNDFGQGSHFLVAKLNLGFYFGHLVHVLFSELYISKFLGHSRQVFCVMLYNGFLYGHFSHLLFVNNGVPMGHR
jgi:hypothetical protein